MRGSFTLDALARMRHAMALNDLSATITASREKVASLRAIAQPGFAHPSNPSGVVSTFMGIKIEESPHFPWKQHCGDCDGSGDGGRVSTFCRTCIGAGKYQVDGMIRDDRGMTLITSRLPRTIAVAWPRDVLVPLREIRRGA